MSASDVQRRLWRKRRAEGVLRPGRRLIGLALIALPCGLFGLLLLGGVLGAPGTSAQAQGDYLVRLKTREFTPPPALELAAIRAQRAGQPEESVHFLVQFVALPDASARQRLAAQGINLVAYVSGNAYVASTNVADLDRLQHVGAVRWAGPLEPDDKLAPNLRAGVIGTWARVDSDRAALTLQLHQDVPVSAGEALVTRLGGTVMASVPVIPAVTAVLPLAEVQRLAREDIVQYVDVVDPALGPDSAGATGAIVTEPRTASPVPPPTPIDRSAPADAQPCSE